MGRAASPRRPLLPQGGRLGEAALPGIRECARPALPSTVAQPLACRARLAPGVPARRVGGLGKPEADPTTGCWQREMRRRLLARRGCQCILGSKAMNSKLLSLLLILVVSNASARAGLRAGIAVRNVNPDPLLPLSGGAGLPTRPSKARRPDGSGAGIRAGGDAGGNCQCGLPRVSLPRWATRSAPP